ncbi:MAG: hypothetical protein KGH85_07550 [Thaumarchaeota archaeon]|nr:hypothetical protein [Nitrososphaerota archaeon]
MKTRSGWSIIRMILDVARLGATKSRIMHDTYLSSEKTSVYLKFLEQHQLLRCEFGSKIYHTTEKGFNMLDESSNLSEFLNKLDPRFSDISSSKEFFDQIN